MLACTLGLVVLAQRADPDRTLPDAVQIASSLLLLACARRLARTNRSLPRGARRCLLVGCALWYGGDVLGLLAAVRGWDLAWVPALEATYLAAQSAWMVCGLLALSRSTVVTSARRTAEGALIGAAVAFAVWTLSAGVPSSVERAGYGVATLLVDGVLVACSVFAALSVPRAHRLPAALVAAATVVLLLADAGFVYRGALDDQVAGWALDMGWSVASLLGAAGLWSASSHHRRGQRLGLDPGGSARWLVPVALSLVGLGITQRSPGQWSGVSVALVIAVLTAVVAREVLTSVEQSELAVRAADVAAQLKRRAEVDDLTGLANRGHLFETLAHLLGTPRADPGALSVAFIDLDGFKRVNDTFGHATGDQLLAEVAGRLRRGLPRADVVARIGGDEFVVVSVTSAAPGALATRIRRLFDEPVEISGARLWVEPSVGVATAADGTESADDLLARADAAAYDEKVAKRTRGSRVRHSTSTPGQVISLEAVLDGLDDGSVRPWYQPIVGTATGSVVGAEALARWTDPAGVTHPAQRFISKLLESGRRADLLALQVAQVCRQFSSGRAASERWFVAVNVAAADVHDPLTFDLVARELARSSLAPERLQLELSGPHLADAGIEGALDRFRDLGVQIALDGVEQDGGLAAMVALDPSVVKFRADLSERPWSSGTWTGGRGRAMVRRFVDVAHDVGIGLQATHVERQAELQQLEHLGCDWAQGFLWSPAVPFDEIAAFQAEPPRSRSQQRA